MRGHFMRVTLALGMLVTALHLAPQHARAAEATQFDLEKAIMEAKTPAQHAMIASYYDRAAATAQAKAEEARKMVEAYRNLAGKGQFRIESRYWQLMQYYKRLAADHTARAVAHRQLVQAVAPQSQ
jgi:hypothetical protein